MAGTVNVNPRHTNTAKTRTAAIKTSPNQTTAPQEIENIILGCQQNEDKIEISLPGNQESEVELPPDMKRVTSNLNQNKQMVEKKNL